MSRGSDDVFPTTEYFGEHPVGCSSGITVREYFAAKALQGLLTNPALVERIWDETGWKTRDDIPSISVEFADELIKALKQSGSS
ncbi:MAG: hypothetical protein ACRC2S_16320 [Waterburya sp.]